MGVVLVMVFWSLVIAVLVAAAVWLEVGWYRLQEQEDRRTGLEVGPFAVQLLVQDGVAYEACFVPGREVESRCCHRARRLLLTVPPHCANLSALYDAAHEVGHAVLDPPVMRHPAPFKAACVAAWLLLAGAGIGVGVPVFLALAIVPGVVLAWVDVAAETRALAFAARKLRSAVLGVSGAERWIRKRMAADAVVTVLPDLLVLAAFATPLVWWLGGGREPCLCGHVLM